VALPPAVAVAAVPTDPNPSIAKACGVDVTLILDASGSVNSSHAVENVRDAGRSFLSALQDTNSTARVIQFATVSQQLADRGLIDANSMAAGGALGQAISGYYNPIPPVSGFTVKTLNQNGNPTQANGWSNSSSNQYTNWQQTLKQTASDDPDLVVFVTDGDPTAYDFDRAGDPFYPSTPPTVGINTNRNTAGAQITIDRAVEAANAVKGNNSRILTVGVGSALNNAASLGRLRQVSGDNVARTLDDFDITTTDVALVPDFQDLESAIRAVVLDLCSPSLTIRKLAQSPTNGDYLPAPGWDFTTTPTVTPGSFDWVLPAGATGPSQTVRTDANGYAQFQWEPTEQNATSAATVSEAVQAGYPPGRPGADNDFRCEAKDENNNTREITGDLTVSGGTASFTLDPIGNEIVTCTVYNSYDYEPAIDVTKVNDPTVIRGDLNPAAQVTSTYQVGNPGNTPLNQVGVTDNQCGPVTPVPATGPNQGDSNADGRLDVTETWTFTCTRSLSGGAGPEPEVVENTAAARGVDPAGTLVTDQATADVALYAPAVTLTKLVNGEESATVTRTDPLTSVSYTYAATNTGNTPLGSVGLVDNRPPCESPTRGPDGPGNNDDIMDVGETWTYSCTAAPADSVVNIAVVTGAPLNPRADNEPFPGPTVTATDSAQVQLVEPGLVLEKSVDQNLVFPGTEVTYTYTARNEGDIDLRNDTGNPGWVADDACSPVTYRGGDDGDGLMNPEETWTFTCSRGIDRQTLNIATIIGQPVDGAGSPVGGVLTRKDVAFVRVVVPDIAVTKHSTSPVVLSPDAKPISGPDTPTVRPATFVYDVSNTGNTPLVDVTVGDDTCEPVTPIPATGPNEGDTNGDGRLDLDEVWSYECSATLDGAELGQKSIVVTNTVTAEGTGVLPGTDTTGPTVTARAQADTTVIHPGLTITKTASQDVVRAGGEVTYTFAVRNAGDVPLDVATLADDKCSPPAYQDGDTNGNGLLDGVNTAAETFTYTCARRLTLPPAGETEDVNTVTVFGIDTLGNGYQAQASASVHVIAPAIRLVKSVDNSLVPNGTTVTYGYDVTNVGVSPIATDDVLARVTLGDIADPFSPTCVQPTLVAKSGGNDDDLLDRDPAETWRYECAKAITEPTTNLAIVAAAGGTTVGLQIPVADFDLAFVQPFTPAITVEKSAAPTELAAGGGPVTYTYLVRNIGDVPLADVASRIGDDTCSPVAYVSGDEDGDGLLDTPTSIFEDALDETWVFTCTTSVTTTTANTVVVTGSPTDEGGTPLCGPDSVGGFPPCDVTATDDAVVVVAGVPPTTPPVPTPPGPNGQLPDTGASGLGTMLATGALALMLGSLLVAVARRRQMR
jgi:LPXTG-motif cell wall-anchored protein